MELKSVTARFLLLLYIFSLTACKPTTKDQFNRTAMLTSLYDEVILPDCNTATLAVTNLKSKQVAFLNDVNQTTLTELKSAYLEAYLAFQKIEMYSFSTERELRIQLNSFPADTTQINANIASGSYNLEAVNNIKAKGFPTIDFLLYAKADAAILFAFNTQSNLRQYLFDVVADIDTKVNTAKIAWVNGRSDFINAAGTDVGSSLGILVNDFSMSIEFCRRERVGNALGYVGIIASGVKAPEKLEAFYAKQSKAILLAHLQSLKTIYANGNKLGFDDYLDYLNASYNGEPLAQTINNQFAVVIQAAENIPVDFDTALITHSAEMETLFLELKKLVVLVKVDMSSSLGVIINYSDNDGD